MKKSVETTNAHPKKETSTMCTKVFGTSIAPNLKMTSDNMLQKISKLSNHKQVVKKQRNSVNLEENNNLETMQLRRYKV